MEFFGSLGIGEIILILILALVILGPQDMQKVGRTVGTWLRKLVMSDTWRVYQDTSKEIRNIPTRLMREANLDSEEINKIKHEIEQSIDTSGIKKSVDEVKREMTIDQQADPKNTIAPPRNPNKPETEKTDIDPSDSNQ